MLLKLLKVPPATVKWCDCEKMAPPYLDRAPMTEVKESWEKQGVQELTMQIHESP
jgi:hypothetical protein